MKSYLKIYLKFTLFILISFTIISLILAGLISFIHLSNFVYHLIINLLAGLIMISGGFLIVRMCKQNPIKHSLIMGLIFLLCSLMLNINDLKLLNILSRPLVLIITVMILSLYQKKIAN